MARVAPASTSPKTKAAKVAAAPLAITKSKGEASRFNKDNAPEFKRELPVPLTEAELKERGKKAGKLQQQIDELEEGLKAQVSELRKDIKEAKVQLHSIVQQLGTGTEGRLVSCFERRDFERNKVETVRGDTGEVVETRAMTAMERQSTLPGIIQPAPGVPKDGNGKAKKAAKDPRFQEAVDASEASGEA